MIYDIVFEPNPILHKVSEQVDLSTLTSSEMKQFVKDMEETMYAKDGVGLAAPQIGKSIQWCVIAKEYNELNKKNCLTLINPTWTKLSTHQAWDQEGCLSVPKVYGDVKRYTNIKVSAYNEKGEKLEFVAKDFFARIIQHETDHLNGILFIEKAKNLYKSE